MNKNLMLCGDDDFKKRKPSKVWLRWIQWGINHLCTCVRILLDFSSRHLFRSISCMSSKQRLPSVRNDLLLQSASSLAKMIRERKLTSETLVSVCIDRIVEVQPFLNVVTQERFKDALDDARKVDRILTSLCPEARKQLATDLPFLGIPFSVSNGLQIKGLLNTQGLPSHCDVMSEDDCELVALLRKLGAIPLCITNSSELGLWYETTNQLHGTSNNPHSLLHSPGGPCGGEACLQSSASIPLSVGSGCVQIPSSFCGIFSHKPSKSNLTRNIGILSRFVDDLEPVVRSLIGESYISNLSSEDEIPITKIRFFYLDCHIGNPLLVSPVSPEIRLALFRVISYLEDSFGIHFRPVQIPELSKALTTFSRAQVDAAKIHFQPPKSLTREWARWAMGRGNYILPNLVRFTAQGITKNLEATTRCLPWHDSAKHNDSTDFDTEILQNELQEILGDKGVLLVPAYPTAVPFHNESLLKPFNFIFSEIFNLVGAPVTTVPLGLDREELPIGVQIVASPSNDRISLVVAKELDRPFGGWIPPFYDAVTFY